MNKLFIVHWFLLFHNLMRMGFPMPSTDSFLGLPMFAKDDSSSTYQVSLDFAIVRTTPQMTRFRDVQHAIIIATVWVDDDKIKLDYNFKKKTWNCVCVVKTERWDVRHQWRRENQDQHSAHETRHLTSECARSLLVSSCCRHTHSLHTTSRGSRLKSACLQLISSMHEVSVTLRLWALHSIQLPTLLILLQSPAAPTALLLPR